ncbi:MAG: hypothetical protein ACKOXK_05320 [Chakrabartia sp.]
MAVKTRLTLALAGLSLAISIGGCSRNDNTQDNSTTVETVDPMTNTVPDVNTTDMSSPSDGNLVVSNTTGSAATDATNTVDETQSSGTSTTRGTRGEAPPH